MVYVRRRGEGTDFVLEALTRSSDKKSTEWMEAKRFSGLPNGEVCGQFSVGSLVLVQT